jgi:hypothetical protein
MGRRYDTLEDMKKRRDAWAAEIGSHSQWADIAPKVVRELDEDIAQLER